jgi:hypothetical protein
MYIPASKNDISFVDITNKNGDVLLTAADQADAFWKFVEQDSYLSKHKGEYAEAFSAVYPWVNRFDVKLTKDFYINVGKTKNTLQLTFDILNVGNLLNSSWGVTKNSVISNSGRILNYAGKDANNRPSFTMNYNTVDDAPVPYNTTFSPYVNSSNCWQLQVGVRYVFN